MLCLCVQEVLIDLLRRHQAAHTAAVAALAQLVAALAANTAAATGSSGDASSSIQQHGGASPAAIRALLKQLRGCQKQLLSGAGLRSIAKQAALVELTQDPIAADGSGSSGRGGGGCEAGSSAGDAADVAGWALRLLREDAWRSRAMEALGQGSR